MLARFSLYGFLKNQRYFEPYLILALLERDCSFTQVGILIAIREVVMQVLEIPSGALADAFGRRHVMVISFCAYVAAYLLLGLATSIAWLGLGMALVGFGDAFRSGTHKAMIFDWLRAQGRASDRVEVYGYTRSWSRIGSVFAIPIAATIAITTGRYADAFLISAIPAGLDVLNLASYPKELDGAGQGRSWRDAWGHLRRGLSQVAGAGLRPLIVEAMAFGGTYKAVKDYVQPLLVVAAATVAATARLSDHDRTSVTTGAVYMAIFGLGALAARRAHRWVRRFETADAAATALWWVIVATTGAMFAALWWGQTWLAVGTFVVLAPLHDIFRPTLVARIDEVGDPGIQATILSIESQATSLTTATVAVAIGWVIDATSGADQTALWPVGAAALALTAPVALARTLRRRTE